MNEASYQPKGSMCMACRKRPDNCSNLIFAGMPVLRKEANLRIVKCTAFVEVYRRPPMGKDEGRLSVLK